MVSVTFSVGARSKVPYVLIGSKTYVLGKGILYVPNERPKKGQYRMSNQMPLFVFFAIYGFKAKTKFRIG